MFNSLKWHKETFKLKSNSFAGKCKLGMLALIMGAFLLSTSASVSASVQADNVHSLGGGVDVTPLGAKELEDGMVEYSYQVSVQAIQSSNRLQTGSTFHTAIPGFAKDVTFTQIGTYDKKILEASLKDNDLFAHERIYLQNRMNASKTVEVPLGITNTIERVLEAQFERSEFLKTVVADQNQAEVNMSLAWNEEIEARKAKGLTTIPNAVAFAGYTINTYDSGGDFQVYDESYASMPGAIKNYQYTILGEGHPMAIRVTFKVSKEQAMKKPHLPLWTALAWRGFSEGGFHSYDDGAQSLYDYASGRKSAQFVGNPEYINANQFDRNGLYGTNAGVTGYTGDWRLIGADITKSAFNYPILFALQANPVVNYFASYTEDYRDIAVSSFVPSSKPEENPSPKPDDKIETSTETATEMQSETSTETTTETRSETSTETTTETRSETSTEMTTQTQSETSVETQNSTKIENKVEISSTEKDTMSNSKKNKSSEILPYTGDAVSGVLYGSAVALISIGAGLFLYSRKKTYKV